VTLAACRCWLTRLSISVGHDDDTAGAVIGGGGGSVVVVYGSPVGGTSRDVSELNGVTTIHGFPCTINQRRVSKTCNR
jgi:hypothetical protein